MKESWRPDNGKIARGAPDSGEPGDSQPPMETKAEQEGGAPKEQESGDKIEKTDEQQIKLMGAAQSEAEARFASFLGNLPISDGPAPYRARPKGKNSKEMRLYMKDLRAAALSVGAGGYNVKDSTAFEQALAKYAEIRTRRSAVEALLSATTELDARDVPEFRKRLDHLEEVLCSEGFTTSAESFNGPVKRMTEEELLRGLEGMVPPQEADTDASNAGSAESSLGKRQESPANASSDEETPAVKKAFEKLRRIETPSAEQIAFASRGLSDAEFLVLKGLVQEKSKKVAEAARSAAKARRKATEAPRAKTESPEEKLNRIKSLASEFDKFADTATPEDALEKYVEIKERLPEGDWGVYKKEVSAPGWNVKESDGTHISENKTSSYIELIPLGKTVKDMREAFGEPVGEVAGVPFWILEDGDAALLVPTGSGDGSRRPQRVGEKGFLSVKGTYYEFKDGAFHTMTEEEVKARQTAMKNVPRAQKQETTPEKPEEAPAKEEETVADVPEKGKRVKSSDAQTSEANGSQEKWSIGEATRKFWRGINKDKFSQGKAFRLAALGLNTKERQRFINELVDAGNTRAILESVRLDLERVKTSATTKEKSAKEEKEEFDEVLHYIQRGSAETSAAQKKAAESSEGDREFLDTLAYLKKNMES